MKRLDLTGQRYGRLQVIEMNGIEKGQTMWECRCDCGKVVTCKGHLLKRGAVKSCGCYRDEGNYNNTHGMSKHNLYYRWKDMVSRCHNPKDTAYHNYGARGIAVCDEWRHDVNAFYEWGMENGYQKSLSIDRIDVNGNYSPDNCRWISKREQLNNTRRNKFVTIDGQTRTLAEWSTVTGIGNDTIYGRYVRGDRGEKLIRPVQREFIRNKKVPS